MTGISGHVRRNTQSRELVHTSWESVANHNQNASVVDGSPLSELEGWSAVGSEPGDEGAGHVFPIWSSGDRVRNAAGQGGVTMQAAAGDGRNWLQLSGAEQGNLTHGIERNVPTIQGAVYTLSFDYAGAIGLPRANSRIGIYVDGKQVATYAHTSGPCALNWQTLNFQFTGNGCAQSVRIQIEGAGQGEHSAMVDDIRIVETLPHAHGKVYGFAGTPIALPAINARLTDTDGSEHLKVELLCLPAGATLCDGTRSLTLKAAGSVNLSGWNLAALSVVPPSGFTGSLQLTVRATATELSTGAKVSTRQAITLQVLSGKSTATPVGVNPYVTLAHSGTQGAGHSSQKAREQIVVKAGPVREIRPAQLTIQAGRMREEEGDEQREHSQSDEWLRHLEASARAHWAQLNGRGY